MPADLRSFLADLDAHGLLSRATREVDPATEAARLMEDADRRGVAVLFERVKGADARLVYNLLGSRAALKLALGDRPVRRFRDAHAQRIEPTHTDDAPVHEVVQEEPDLRKLPLVVHAEKDAGPYVTAGMVIAHDPDNGARNVSFNRMMLAGPAETGIRMMPTQHLGAIQVKAEAEGRDLPVAVAIGLHPVDELAAATSLPTGEDELALAGGLRNEAVRLTRAKTVDLDVPADAEIVIEGFVRAGVREPEGPFGDFLQSYIPEGPNHRLQVTAITHRREPIFQTMVAGSREDVNLLGLSRAALVAAAVEATGAELVDLNVGPTILGCTLAIRQRWAGDAKNAALAALGAYGWLKYCIVVDHDVDVHDMDDVWWAVTARSSPERALRVIAGAPAFPRDRLGVHGSRAIIDATIPFGEWTAFERKRPPGGGRLRLDDYA